MYTTSSGIFGLAIVGIIGLIHDGCNDLAMATRTPQASRVVNGSFVGVGAESCVIIRHLRKRIVLT
ncbi:hypothetical protein [Nostoc sp.]|uniref:hypothetical protein n=1 Tax=Nostoc sp. TaxID=1180 RepID=UPI002FFD5428